MSDEMLRALEASEETQPFRVVDPQKRSRFDRRDCEKLMLIVTRRKSFSAPHGTGETEWQAVANELNDAVDASFSLRACRDKVAALVKQHQKQSYVSRRASGVAEDHTVLSDYIEAYLQLKSAFEEKKQTAKDKKTRKAKRLASAGGRAMQKAAQRLKRRKTAASSTAPASSNSSSDDEEGTNRDGAGGGSNAEGRDELRAFLGADYSSDEEEKREESSDEGSEGEEDAPTSNRTRTRLRVSEIWAKEEAMMEKERQLQASRDRNLERVLEALVAQTKLLFEELKRGHNSNANSQL